MRVLSFLLLVVCAMALITCAMAQEDQDIDECEQLSPPGFWNHERESTCPYGTIETNVTNEWWDGFICCQKIELGCDEDNMKASRTNAQTAVTGNIGFGGTTLAFVFDTTGSMGHDLVHMKKEAEEIVDDNLRSPHTHIHNYILVPFNDPKIGPLTNTTDPAAFHEAIKEITVDGGGDCPEDSLAGIIMALEAVEPNSHVYVFTDASANDKENKDKVIRLIHEKQAQVTFILTGDICGEGADISHTLPSIYNTISSVSSGHQFKIGKEHVNKILGHVRSSLGEKKVNLLSVQFGYFDLKKFKVIVDNTLKGLTVSVTSTKIDYIQINGPDGELVRMERTINLDNVITERLKNPTPGEYNIVVKKSKVTGNKDYTNIRVTGDSPISFEQGFSLKPTADFTKTSRRPITGVTSYILVKPMELTDFGDMYRFQLITLFGQIKVDSSLKLIPGSDAIYNGTSFIAPDQSVHIKIFGCTLSGSKFERISATAITPSNRKPGLCPWKGDCREDVDCLNDDHNCSGSRKCCNQICGGHQICMDEGF